MESPRYGNSIRVGSTRIAGFIPFPTFIIFIASFLFAFIFIILEQIVFGIALIVVAFFLLAIFGIPFGSSDRTLAARFLARMRHNRRVADGEATFVNNHLSDRAAEDLMGLPGALHTIKPVKAVDGMGSEVELLHHTGVDMATVTFACAPRGVALQTQEDTDMQVGSFSGFLGSLASEGGLHGVAVTVDSIQKSSVPMAEAALEVLDPNSPAASQAIYRESIGAMPLAVSNVSTYVTLGWELSELDDDVEGAYAEIVSRLPRHESRLRASGAGPMHAMSDPEYGDLMYTAYNPDREREVERDIQNDRPVVRHFERSGPDFIDGSHKRVVLHDGVASMTVMMMVPDLGKKTETTYRRLFEPSKHFLRKRVTMLYRPIPIHKNRSRINNAERKSTAELSSQQHVTQFDTTKAQGVQVTMNQMTRGALVHEWALMATVTFEPTKAAQREAENEIKTMMGGMEYHFVDYAADAAFHQTLPLGIFPWVYAADKKLLENSEQELQKEK